jgi:hypothetical protein
MPRGPSYTGARSRSARRCRGRTPSWCSRTAVRSRLPKVSFDHSQPEELTKVSQVARRELYLWQTIKVLIISRVERLLHGSDFSIREEGSPRESTVGSSASLEKEGQTVHSAGDSCSRGLIGSEESAAGRVERGEEVRHLGCVVLGETVELWRFVHPHRLTFMSKSSRSPVHHTV